MARRVVSLVRTGPAALRERDPVLEANAYAVAEDLELTVVLRGRALEHALAEADLRCGDVAGLPLPPGSSSADLRGLLESGTTVVVARDDLAAAGLRPADLVPGVTVLDAAALARALRDADAVLSW